MKTPLFSAFIAIFSFWMMGGCDKVEPSFCDKEVSLGEFSSTVEMPYDSFEYVLLLGENGDTGSMSINHPSNTIALFYHNNPVQLFTSDCQSLRSIEKYDWSIRDKRNTVLVGMPDYFTSILIKALPVFDETKPENGPIAQVFKFYKTGEGNNIEATDFMSILAEETAAGSGQGKEFEHGSSFIGEMAINGKTYSDVYTNEDNLDIGIQNLYFTFADGIVGVKDEEGVMWRLDD